MSQQNPSRFGIVDVGTNAVRFEIYQLAHPRSAQNSATRIYQRREVFRLGDTLETSKRMNPHTLPAALVAFEEFAKLCTQKKVYSIRAAGTSVFRRALDAKEVQERIFKQSSIAVEIISGAREAQLIAQGVVQFEANLPKAFLLIDIGGGSTELSYSKDDTLLFTQSIPLGAITAQTQYLKTAPPSERCLADLITAIQSQLRTIPSVPKESNIAICSSGTARALAEIQGQTEFEIHWLSNLIERIKHITMPELQRLTGVQEARADILLAGAVLLREIAVEAAIERIRVSQFSLRHGLLVESIRDFQQQG